MSKRLSLPENRPLRILLIDDDSVFRLGLRLWLNRLSNFEVVAEANSGTDALAILAAHRNADGSDADASEEAIVPDSNAAPIDLVILNLSLGKDDPTQIQGLHLCRQIRDIYSPLPVLLLSSLSEPVMLAAAQEAGATGFCSKSINVDDLEGVIWQVASGQPYWQLLPPVNPPTRSPLEAAKPAAEQLKIPRPLAIVRRNLRLSGLKQIDAALDELTRQLQTLNLSLLDRAVLAGRYRELRASRWLVERLLATPDIADIPEPTEPDDSAIASTSASNLKQTPLADLAITPTRLDDAIVTKRLQSVLFDAVLTALQTDLVNQTDSPLEIDILRDNKKRELLYLVLRKFEDSLDDLRYSQIQPEQLIEKRSQILFDLWQAVTIDFFGKYYTVTIRNVDIEVVNVVLQDVAIVQSEILDKIPFVDDLLAHLLFHTPLTIDSVSYAPGNPDALARAEAILDNLLIQVANAVIQPLLNRFADAEVIKLNFYDRRLASSREIERFRNSLSWKYRLERYVSEPKDIFESQYRLFIFQGRGIKQISIYAPRNQELDDLSGIQFVVTLALETRDAIAPRLRSAISVVGSSLVYVLTEVIGRGIGLIGRGILQGIGNAWQSDRDRR